MAGSYRHATDSEGRLRNWETMSIAPFPSSTFLSTSTMAHDGSTRPHWITRPTSHRKRGTTCKAATRHCPSWGLYCRRLRLLGRTGW